MSSLQEPNAENLEKPSARPAEREFAAQFRQAYPRLTAVAAGVLGRQEGAEDVVQQAAGIAVAKGKKFATPPAFVAWMIGVVRRCALNERRKSHRRRTYATSPQDIDEFVDNSPREPAPVDPATGQLVAGQGAFEDELLHALGQLGEDARCCLLLRTVHDMSYAEIADLLGLPRGTAMSHVHRSRQHLRQCLGSGPAARQPNQNSAVSLKDEST